PPVPLRILPLQAQRQTCGVAELRTNPTWQEQALQHFAPNASRRFLLARRTESSRAEIRPRAPDELQFRVAFRQTRLAFPFPATSIRGQSPAREKRARPCRLPRSATSNFFVPLPSRGAPNF